VHDLTLQCDELYERLKERNTGYVNIPNKVRIGSMDYEVLLTDETLVLNGSECFGTIDYNKHLIKINNYLQDIQGNEQTFLHEVVHGIIRERHLDIKNSDEETIVDEIATGLHQLIKDNSFILGGNVLS
jgi:hypothetical protein